MRYKVEVRVETDGRGINDEALSVHKLMYDALQEKFKGNHHLTVWIHETEKVNRWPKDTFMWAIVMAMMPVLILTSNNPSNPWAWGSLALPSVMLLTCFYTYYKRDNWS